MSHLFISDLHLSPDNPSLTQSVCDFLNSQTSSVSHLYILGDIFNTWLGDDVVPEEYVPFINTLAKLSESGIALFLMVGNRDFMLGKAFAQSVGATLLGDTAYIDMASKHIALMHGDTLCTDDESYQRYRKVVRNRLLQWCFLHLPTSFRQRISDKIKQKSREKKQHKTTMIMDVNANTVIQAFDLTQADILIHGHTHRPAIHEITLPNGKNVNRVVLGDWAPEVSYLTLDEDMLSLHDHRLTEQKIELSLA